MIAESLREAAARHPYIAADESHCGGAPRITGTRIRVIDIATEHDQMGLRVDQIIEAHPHLNPAQVYDALSYYYENKAELDADMERREREAEELRREIERTQTPLGG
jgi:uncharacterized protein (DUF433 family)